jgi:putative restriction endonuclease
MTSRKPDKARFYVGVTDDEWFRFLRDRPDLDEVNFWQPGGGRGFSALTLGQPFLFKLHSPLNFIAGGAFFRHYSRLPVSTVWEVFGEKNGASSYREMRRLIEKHRKLEPGGKDDYQVGCIILGDPFFLRRDDWVPSPTEFRLNIVSGKTFDMTSAPGSDLWERVRAALASAQPAAGHEETRRELAGPMFGDTRPVAPRLGQGAFRVMVTDAYARSCAVTGERALPVLQAAHIRPVSEGGAHRLDNGLLLRSDLHALFDRGYISVTPERKVLVSRKLKEDFDNGEPYFPLAGGKIHLPERELEHPAREFLEWHVDTVYRG